MSELTPKFIVTWRKLAPDLLDWDYHTCMDLQEAKQVVSNIRKKGVKQWNCFEIARELPELSSRRMEQKP